MKKYLLPTLDYSVEKKLGWEGINPFIVFSTDVPQLHYLNSSNLRKDAKKLYHPKKKNDTQNQKTPKGKVTKTKERQINQNQTKINRGENYRKKKQRPKQKERTGKN